MDKDPLLAAAQEALNKLCSDPNSTRDMIIERLQDLQSELDSMISTLEEERVYELAGRANPH